MRPRKSDIIEEVAKYPSRPSVISVLRSSTLLNSLSEDDRQALAAVSHMAFAERGQTIWFSGAQVDFIGIVGTGFVKMVKSTSSGHELTHEVMGPGQVFGLLGTIDGGGCPLSARAVSHMWYLKVPKREFMPIYEHTGPLHNFLVRRTTVRLRQTQDMLARLSSGTVESRIAAILLMLAESYGHLSEEGLVIEVPLTRQDIAEMAGTTVESTIRTMSAWQKRGEIITKSKSITIVDREKMTRLIAI